jgi:hypothetical protein
MWPYYINMNQAEVRIVLVIDIRQLLTRAVFHGKAGVQFFDCPRRRKAAG